MTVARSVGDVLGEHVVFEIECIDRMYLNVYVPGLQYAAGQFAGRPARRMDATNLFAWGCKEAKGIMIAQVLLAGGME